MFTRFILYWEGTINRNGRRRFGFLRNAWRSWLGNDQGIEFLEWRLVRRTRFRAVGSPIQDYWYGYDQRAEFWSRSNDRRRYREMRWLFERRTRIDRLMWSQCLGRPTISRAIPFRVTNYGPSRFTY